MSDYYGTQQKVNKKIDQLFNDILKGKQPSIDMNLLLLDLTSKYAIGTKYIEKRIEMLIKTSDQVIIDGDLLINVREVDKDE